MGITTADLIADAPGWALTALTMPQEGSRLEGRLGVARHVYGTFYRSHPAEARQLPLPLL